MQKAQLTSLVGEACVVVRFAKKLYNISVYLIWWLVQSKELQFAMHNLWKSGFIISVLCTLAFNLETVSGQSITPGNLISTAQIVVKSCYFPGVNDERTAWKFFACYDWAPVRTMRCLILPQL